VARGIKGKRRRDGKRWDRGGKKIVEAYVGWEREDRSWRDLVEEDEVEAADGKGWWVGVENGMSLGWRGGSGSE